MALPDGKTEAWGSHDGYTYTQRVCQEYGQQPRHYRVRDPIAGSDWRNDGGWAIILVSSGTPAKTVVAFTNPYANGGWLAFWPTMVGSRIIASDGTAGFVINADTARVIIDRNNNGVLDSGDATYSGSKLERRDRGTTTIPASGSRYIRWANMLWCRQ